MKRVQANVAYSIIHASMWGMYAIIFAFAKPFLEEQGLSDIWCSVVLGSTAALSVLLNVVISELVSRIKKLKLYMVTIVIGALILLGLMGMLTSHTVLILGGISIVLALLQLIPGMCNSIGMDAIAKGAPATYSIARGIGSLSYALSAVAAGRLADIGMTSIALLSGVLGITLVIGVIWFHLCAEKGLAEPQTDAQNIRKKDNFLGKNPGFTLFLVGATLLCISHFYVCTFTWDVVKEIGLNKTELGIAAGVSAFVELPIMFGFVFIAKKIRCHVLLKFAAFMFLAKTLGLLFATNAMGIYLAEATQIVGYGLYAIASVTYAGQVMGKDDAVRAQSYLAATISLGNVIAMSTGGLLLRWGVDTMLWVATGCALAGALVVLISAKKTAE